MVTFLRKLFIKDYKNVNNKEVRKKHGLLAAFGGIVMNLILFSVKLVVGILSASMSIISDAINNLGDMFSCVVNVVGFSLASKKADSEHPFGHERIEYIAGMIVSFLIVSVAVMLGYSSVLKLINHESNTSYSIISFVLLGVAILGKILLGLYYRGIGKAIDSVTLKASMQDSFNDCISTGVVLIAALVQYFFNSLWWVDPAMSLIVALFVLFSGIKMIKETASPLVGLTPDSELVQSIVDEVKKYPVCIGVHDVVVHSYGPTRIFMTLHCEVDGYGDMFEAHDSIDDIEGHIMSKYGVELTIHMDPLDTRNKELPLIKEELTKILNEISPDLSFHDLRMTNGPTHSNVLFDVVISHKLQMEEKEIISTIQKKIKEYNKKYNAVIKIDNNYIG